MKLTEKVISGTQGIGEVIICGDAFENTDRFATKRKLFGRRLFVCMLLPAVR